MPYPLQPERWLHSGTAVGEHPDIRLIDCTFCGYIHQIPLPSQADVDALYADDQYVSLGPPDWFQKEAQEHVQGDWHAFYQYQVNLLGGLGLPLLDVGAGAGWFLHYWAKRGGKGWGIEPSPRARHVSPVSSMLYSDEVAWLEASEQVVYSSMHVRANLVLEHILDPRAFIEHYAMYLGKRGKLMIVVPNDNSWVQRLVGGPYWIAKPHINYFTPHSLRSLLRACGLRVVHESATYPIDLNLLLGRDYRGNDVLGRKCHRARLNFEQQYGSAAFHLYSLLYKLCRVGRELIFVASKE